MLSTKKLKVFLFISILSFILLIIFWLQLNKSPHKPKVYLDIQNSKAIMVINDFHHLEMELDIKLWELDAAMAEVYEDFTFLKDMKIVYFQKQDEPLTITAQTGKINMKTKDVVVEGNVIALNSRGYKLTTDKLTWIDSLKRLTTEENIIVNGPNLFIEGRGLVANADLEQIEIKEDVKVEFKNSVTVQPPRHQDTKDENEF